MKANVDLKADRDYCIIADEYTTDYFFEGIHFVV
jgi:hypothetical protein